MKIEIGKEYAVSPRWKKSFEENEYWVDDKTGKRIVITTLWRGGTVKVTPQNEDEVEWLEDALTQGDEDAFEPYTFEEHEYDSAYDGCSVDLTFGNIDEEEAERLQDGYDEEGTMFLEEEGFDCDDSEVYMYGELEIEEV